MQVAQAKVENQVPDLQTVVAVVDKVGPTLVEEELQGSQRLQDKVITVVMLVLVMELVRLRVLVVAVPAD
jgi:hypothetical protein